MEADFKSYLKDTTLVCVDCVNIERAIKVIEKSLKEISVDSVKLLTSLQTNYKYAVKIDSIKSTEEYSFFCIKKLVDYIDTKYVLIIQYDGWVLNGAAWDNDWYNYDYIGGNTIWTEDGENGKGGNGGFSFRSKKILEFAKNNIKNNECHTEDVRISRYRNLFENAGFKFATRKIQENFSVADHGVTSKGRLDPHCAIWKGSFGHHCADLRNYKPLIPPIEKKITVICAKYKENTDWLNLINSNVDTKIFNKYDGNNLLPNIGRESHTYLKYIIDNYDNLSDICVFTQGNPEDHKGRNGKNCKDTIIYELNNNILHNEYYSFNNNIVPLEFYVGNFIYEFAKKLLPNELIRNEFHPNACFSVTKQNILKRPKNFYENCIKIFETAKNPIDPIEGHYFERLWEAIFSLEVILITKTEDVINKLFSFGRTDGSHIGNLMLQDNGIIQGYTNPNERTWKISERGTLCFCNDSGKVTTEFIERNSEGILVGTFNGTKNWHTLKETDKIKISLLTFDVTHKCTLTCTECCRNIPFFKDKKIEDFPVERLVNDLKKLSNALEISLLEFEGGEPLLYNNIVELIKLARKNKCASKYGITTNATLLNKITDELISIVDVFNISIYPNLIDDKIINDFVYKVQNFGKQVDLKRQNSFHKIFKNKAEDVPILNCKQYKCCYNYAYGYFFLCAVAFSTNKIIHNKVIDGICLDDYDSIYKIKTHINSNIVYDACKYCEMSTGIKSVPWSQMTKEEWMKFKKII